MVAAPLPENEDARLRELEDLRILDTLPEQAYDDITYLASSICEAPIALVSFVDGNRQWFKSRVGLDATETPRDQAFCAHAILDPSDLLIVPDAHDDYRFVDNPLVTDQPSIRFYAGAPLVTAAGNALGTLCVIDSRPRQLSTAQVESLRALSRQVIAQLELRRTVAELRERAATQKRYERQLMEYQGKLEENLETISLLSLTDPLTGLNNRRALMDRLDEECVRSARYGAELSFALVDVDGFKPYNDDNGHLAGDAALVEVANLIKRESRATDFVARYGGDEFAVVFSNTGIQGAGALGERIRLAIREARWAGREVTVSIGIAEFGPNTATPQQLIGAADHALYDAKDAGRDRVAVITGA